MKKFIAYARQFNEGIISLSILNTDGGTNNREYHREKLK